MNVTRRDHDDKNHDEVDSDHSHAAPEANDVSASNALGEEHAVMVEIFNAHVAIFTVLSRLWVINLANVTVLHARPLINISLLLTRILSLYE